VSYGQGRGIVPSGFSSSALLEDIIVQTGYKRLLLKFRNNYFNSCRGAPAVCLAVNIFGTGFARGR